MTRNSGIVPNQRLWTPWRMAYVGGNSSSAGCVFCDALAGSDDLETLIVHRGVHAFVILNLFPYNTGHLMVVPNDHVNEPAALSPEARSEMAELTASFCTGLRTVMGCDGINSGMNLGSAAGAGIADHLHQHIVPRWSGDANFMPIIGGTKVLPELLPSTYARIRAEICRQKCRASTVHIVLTAVDRSGIFLDGTSIPRIVVVDEIPVWKSAMTTVTSHSTSAELLGWAGSSTTLADMTEPPSLAVSFAPLSGSEQPYTYTPTSQAAEILVGRDLELLNRVGQRFAIDDSGE